MYQKIKKDTHKLQVSMETFEVPKTEQVKLSICIYNIQMNYLFIQLYQCQFNVQAV